MMCAKALIGFIFVGLLSFQTEAGAQTAGHISISGKQILKDNQPWVPKSITVNNPEHLSNLVEPINNDEAGLVRASIDFMGFYGSDAVRIFVVQDYLDPQYKIPSWMPQSPTPQVYIPQILNAVYTARQKNIPVILVMTSWAQGAVKAEARSHGMWPPPCIDGANLPTPADWISYPTTGTHKGEDCGPSTSRAWHALMKPPAHLHLQNLPNYSIINDPGVMFEIYNEPTSTSDNNGDFGSCLTGLSSIADTPNCEKETDWTHWQRHHQNVISDIRGFGAKNVVVIDGLMWAHLFNDLNDYRPTDPSSPSNPQIIYAEHPYLNPGFDTTTIWEQWFGNFASQNPFMVTEFNAVAGGSTCFPAKPTVASQLLQYLDQSHVGVNIWAYDSYGTVFKGPPPANSSQYLSNLTTFSGDTESCSAGDTGAAGWLFYNYFQGQNNLIPAPTHLQVQSSGDGYSLLAAWQSGSSTPLKYVAAILPQWVAPLYSPPEGAFPPQGTTDVQNATSIMFSNLAPGTYQVEVWSYDPQASVIANQNGSPTVLYSSPAILQNITVNGNAHLQVLDRDFPFITDDIARIASPYTTPDGTQDGELLIENNANNQHGIVQNLTEGAAKITHTFSVAVKAYAPVVAESRGESNEVVTGKPRDLSVVAFSNRLNANMQNAVCDPSTGKLQLQYPTPQTPTPMVYLGNGFYLCTVIFTQEPEGTQVWIKLNNPDFMQDSGENQSLWSYTGDGVSGLEVWNFQLFKIE